MIDVELWDNVIYTPLYVSRNEHVIISHRDLDALAHTELIRWPTLIKRTSHNPPPAGAHILPARSVWQSREVCHRCVCMCLAE